MNCGFDFFHFMVHSFFCKSCGILSFIVETVPYFIDFNICLIMASGKCYWTWFSIDNCMKRVRGGWIERFFDIDFGWD